MIAIALIVPTTCLAQATEPSAQGPATQAERPRGEMTDRERQLTTDFAGLSFGAGLSFTRTIGGSEPIDEAVVDEQGNVRVTKRHSGIARVMLEAHYFWTPTAGSTPPRVGTGPFVAIQPGSDQIISAIAGGIMVGFRRTDTSKSFNVGVGVVSDMNARTLGHGFTEDAPAPLDASGKPAPIRYEEETRYGLIFLTSFAW
jgi:hypothetical protein